MGQILKKQKVLDPNIADRIRRVVMDQLGSSESEVADFSRSFKDLDADSLDEIELTMSFEVEFDIEISDDDVVRISTLQDAYDYLEHRLKS